MGCTQKEKNIDKNLLSGFAAQFFFFKCKSVELVSIYVLLILWFRWPWYLFKYIISRIFTFLYVTFKMDFRQMVLCFFFFRSFVFLFLQCEWHRLLYVKMRWRVEIIIGSLPARYFDKWVNNTKQHISNRVQIHLFVSTRRHVSAKFFCVIRLNGARMKKKMRSLPNQ